MNKSEIMKKNDIVKLTIEDMSVEGSGIGHYCGMAVFVPLTAPGDVINAKIVKVKSRYAFGIVDSVIKQSNKRIQNDCPHFNKCGGCVYRHISYESECEIKYGKVYEAMKRIGGIDIKPKPIIFDNFLERYRNKAQYPVSPDKKTGFFAPHSHRVIPCGDCLLQPEIFSQITDAFNIWLKESDVSVYDETTETGLLRHFYLRYAEATDEIMATVVINGGTVPEKDALITKLVSASNGKLKSIYLNHNGMSGNVILGTQNTLIYGSPYITDILCDVKIRLSPLSFYQVNRNMAQRLYRKAAEYANADNADILDLYCGTGTIGLTMAKQAKSITGVEIIPQAIEDAKANARENGFKNTRFICADAAAAAAALKNEGISPNTVILDPPRKGCSEELIKTVTQDFRPERIVYVSCDPATLARDTALAVKYGYELIEYTPVDMFPRTAHVETVALLVRT